MATIRPENNQHSFDNTDMTSIPVVDFSIFAIDKETVDESCESAQRLAREIYDAFNTVGFVYLKNHGIADSKIHDAQQVTEKFFSLTPEQKLKYVRPSDGGNHGWVALEREKLNPARPGDLKEAFNVPTVNNEQAKWPTQEVPDFEPTVSELYKHCTRLTCRILQAASMGLKLKDITWLPECHKGIGSSRNATTMRILYYPPLADDSVIKPNQVRCGEHSDYGTITLLFQDELGGLQVLPLDGDYIPAPYIPGCVIVNIGDLMQRWTADQLKSTKHRVLIPEEEFRRRKARRSIAFFVHPDDDILVECLDGSNKYPPVTGGDYLTQRFAATYEY